MNSRLDEIDFMKKKKKKTLTSRGKKMKKNFQLEKCSMYV